MSSHRVLIAASLAGALMLPLTAVHAQSSLGNKSIPGVCMLSRSAVLGNSKVGKAADARLKQLIQKADGRLQAEQKPLEQAIQNYRKKAKTMTASERESQQKALQKRVQSFQQNEQELKKRVQITHAKAMQRIGNVVQPLLVSVYKKHGCGILLDADSVLGGDQANDLTAAVTKALNKKMTTISFSLAPLPTQSSGNNGN